MGWNRIEAAGDGGMLRSDWMYFANSYRLEQVSGAWRVATTEHGGTVVSAIEQGSLLAPKSILVDYMQSSVLGAVPTILECEQAIQWLEQNRLIVGVNPALGGDAKYRITDLGRTEV
jgi:hypothetical protein